MSTLSKSSISSDVQPLKPGLRRLMRSKLFVPGSRPELFPKAFASAADAISFDLEDAVSKDRKIDARLSVGSFLRAQADTREKITVVRVNSLRTGMIHDDLKEVLVPGLDVINLPMVESARDVRELVELLTEYEKTAGIRNPVGVLANIETPRGLRMAAEIAGVDPRVIGLQLGYGDLFEPSGIERGSGYALDFARICVRLAAAEARIPAYDGAFPTINDADGFAAECRSAFSLGFEGKSCIHPSQVQSANMFFTPSVRAVEKARRVVAAAAAAAGAGAFALDGEMIDEPYLQRAKALLLASETEFFSARK